MYSCGSTRGWPAAAPLGDRGALPSRRLRMPLVASAPEAEGMVACWQPGSSPQKTQASNTAESRARAAFIASERAAAPDPPGLSLGAHGQHQRAQPSASSLWSSEARRPQRERPEPGPGPAPGTPLPHRGTRPPPESLREQLAADRTGIPFARPAERGRDREGRVKSSKGRAGSLEHVQSVWPTQLLLGPPSCAQFLGSEAGSLDTRRRGRYSVHAQGNFSGPGELWVKFLPGVGEGDQQSSGRGHLGMRLSQKLDWKQTLRAWLLTCQHSGVLMCAVEPREPPSCRQLFPPPNFRRGTSGRKADLVGSRDMEFHSPDEQPKPEHIWEILIACLMTRHWAFPSWKVLVHM